MKTLNEIPRENPFKVPENYFEGVTTATLTVTANAGLNGNEAEPCIEPLPQDHRFDCRFRK